MDCIFVVKIRCSLTLRTIEALKEYCGENGSFKENGDIATISFSGSIDELNDKINTFIQSNDPQKIEGKSYFNIIIAEAETTNNFTNAFTGNIAYDLSPIVGNTRILFNDVGGLFADYYYQGNFEIDEEGNKTVASNGNVSFTVVKISLIITVLFIISCVLLIFGVILLIVKRKDISNFISDIKEKKKVSVKQREENPTITESDNDLVEVCVSANAETINSTETDTEEDLL